MSDATPLTNRGAEWRMLVKTGDSVDLRLGTDPKADPGRREPVPGDLRILIARQDDGGQVTPVVVLCRHRVPGAPAYAQTTYSSPWRIKVVDLDILDTE